MKENEKACKQELQYYITNSVEHKSDLSVYELTDNLNAHSVFLIYKKYDVEMYYGSFMGDEVKEAIADWIDNNKSMLRDELPTPFPCSEEEAEEADTELGYEEVLDMYFCIEEFAETVQEFCNLYFKDYKR